MSGPKRVQTGVGQQSNWPSAKTRPFQGIYLPPNFKTRVSLPPNSPIVLDGNKLDFAAPLPFYPYHHRHKGGRAGIEDQTFAFSHPSGHLDVMVLLMVYQDHPVEMLRAK